VRETGGDPLASSEAGTQVLAAISTHEGYIDGSTVTDSTRVMVSGSSSMFGDALINQYGSNIYNAGLFFYSIQWLAGSDAADVLYIEAKVPPSFAVAAGNATVNGLVAILAILVIPAILFGLALWVYRRRKICEQPSIQQGSVLMKNKLRNMLIMSGVLVVLLALWLVPALMPGSDESDATTAATTHAPMALLTVDPAEVARIAVHNNYSDLTLLPEQSLDASGEGLVRWQLAENQGFPISQTSLTDLAEAALTMTYTEVIVDNPDDLAAFGLNRPVSTISIVFSNGSSTTVEFGSNLSSGKGTYARISQDTRIYAVDSRFKDLSSQSLADLIDLSQTVGGLKITDLSSMEFSARRPTEPRCNHRAPGPGRHCGWFSLQSDRTSRARRQYRHLDEPAEQHSQSFRGAHGGLGCQRPDALRPV